MADKYSHPVIDVTVGLVPLKENKECRGTQINGNRDWEGGKVRCVQTLLTGWGGHFQGPQIFRLQKKIGCFYPGCSNLSSSPVCRTVFTQAVRLYIPVTSSPNKAEDNRFNCVLYLFIYVRLINVFQIKFVFFFFAMFVGH